MPHSTPALVRAAPRARLAGLLGLLLLSAACGGGSPAPAPTPSQGCQGAADGTSCGSSQVCRAGTCVDPPRTVASAFTTTWWPSSGARSTALVAQPAGTSVSALVPGGSAPGYRVFPGTLSADGSFSIPGVPSGSYLLRIDQPGRGSYLDANNNAVTLDYTRTVLTEFTSSSPPLEALSGSRRGAAQPTSETATLSFSNLDAYVNGDMLMLVGPDAGVDAPLLSSAPTPTATLSVPDVAWSAMGGLPDFTQGDVLYAIQRKTSVAAGLRTRLTTRYARLQSLDFSTGTAAADVPMLAAPLTQSQPVNLRTSQFEALRPGVAPSTQASRVEAGLNALPHSNGYPAPSGWAMRFAYMDADASTGDRDLGAIAYGGFGETFWKEFRIAGLSFDADLAAPGSTSTIVASGSILSWEPLPGASAPIAPVLGPVTNPLINGLPAFTPRSGVGLEPTLSWSAPALGTPTGYLIRIVPAYDRFYGEVLLATVYGARSLRVPPGVLTAGSAYYAVITAVRGPQYALDLSPNLDGFPRHTADAITTVFVP